MPGLLRAVEFRRDRPGVVVSYKTRWRVTPNVFGYDPSKDYIAITVTDRGRRPVTITNVGAIAKHKAERHSILSDSVVYGPRELTEGKATHYLVEQDPIDLSSFKWFVAFDMTGRTYRCKISQEAK